MNDDTNIVKLYYGTYDSHCTLQNTACMCVYVRITINTLVLYHTFRHEYCNTTQYFLFLPLYCEKKPVAKQTTDLLML